MEKLTVSEYAKRNSISIQAVYKKINKLNTIEEVRNGRKQIIILLEDEVKTRADDIQPNSTRELNSTNSTQPHQEQADSTGELNSTRPDSTRRIQPDSTSELNPSIIDVLKEQLQEKDKQIERLQDAIEEKDKQIKEQFERFTALLLRSQELEAITHKSLGEAGDTKQEPIEETKEQVKPTKQEQKKNTGFFSRLFKRI